MRKLLVFDADRGLSTISENDETLNEILGVPPIACDSMEQFMAFLKELTVVKPKENVHPVLTNPDNKGAVEWEITFGQKAQEIGIYGIALDTMSHMGRVSFRSISKNVMGKELNEVKSIDRGVYLQFRDYGNRVLNSIKICTFPVIVNVHERTEEGEMGDESKPGFITSLRDDMGEYFDAIFYAKTKRIDGKVEYYWQVEKDNRHKYAAIRQRSVREALGNKAQIPQDFDMVLSAYEATDKKDPKILVIAPTKQGKTSALATVNKYYPPDFKGEQL